MQSKISLERVHLFALSLVVLSLLALFLQQQERRGGGREGFDPRGRERTHVLAEAGVITTRLSFSTHVRNFYNHLPILYQKMLNSSRGYQAKNRNILGASLPCKAESVASASSDLRPAHFWIKFKKIEVKSFSPVFFSCGKITRGISCRAQLGQSQTVDL